MHKMCEKMLLKFIKCKRTFEFCVQNGLKKSIKRQIYKYKIPVPNVNTLRKMYFFQSRVHVIELHKSMTTIPG